MYVDCDMIIVHVCRSYDNIVKAQMAPVHSFLSTQKFRELRATHHCLGKAMNTINLHTNQQLINAEDRFYTYSESGQVQSPSPT